MQLTRESDYALTGLAVLVEAGEGATMPLSSVAAERDLPEAFLARIFRELTRHGILAAKRGRGNGYSLARSAGSITLREVIEAVEGPEVFDRCLLWRNRCSDDDPCPLHHQLEEPTSQLKRLVERTTLADYVAESPHALAGRAEPST